MLFYMELKDRLEKKLNTHPLNAVLQAQLHADNLLLFEHLFQLVRQRRRRGYLSKDKDDELNIFKQTTAHSICRLVPIWSPKKSENRSYSL